VSDLDLDAEELCALIAANEPRPPQGARTRVWAALSERRRRRRARWLVPSMATFVMLAVASAWALRVRAGRPAALVLDDAGHERAVHAGEALPRLAELSLIDLQGAGRMVAGAGTFARLERLERAGVEIALDRGSLLLHVTPRPASAPFIVRTPRFTARVVGTVLRVAVHADGSASLAVGHGAVELKPIGAAPVTVHTGERWPTEVRDVPLPSELERLGAVDLEGATADDFTPRAVAAPATPPALPSSPLIEEETALYEAGFRALHDRRDARAALDIWELERARFPEGVLARDVQASIIDALVALKRSSRAEAEIASYLHAEPSGLRAPELHFVRALLQRQHDGDCRRARHEVELALQHPSEPWQKRARALRLSCGNASR
jgi:hypothetical protein